MMMKAFQLLRTRTVAPSVALARPLFIQPQPYMGMLSARYFSVPLKIKVNPLADEMSAL